MGMSVLEAQARISSAEFAEWMAYAQLEPFGGLQDDLRAGAIASTIANVNRDSDKTPRPFEPGDFFPSLTDAGAAEAPEQTPKEQLAIMRMITDAMARGNR